MQEVNPTQTDANISQVQPNESEVISSIPSDNKQVDPSLDSMFKWQDINILLQSYTNEADKANLLMQYETWKNSTWTSDKTDEQKWHSEADKILEEIEKSQSVGDDQQDKQDTQPKEEDPNIDENGLTPEEIQNFVSLFETTQKDNAEIQAKLDDANKTIQSYKDNLWDLATIKITNERLTQEANIWKQKHDSLLEEKAARELERNTNTHRNIIPISDDNRSLFKTLNQDYSTLEPDGKANILESISLLREKITWKDLYDNIQDYIRWHDNKQENIENNISIQSAYNNLSKRENKTAEAAADRNYL